MSYECILIRPCYFQEQFREVLDWLTREAARLPAPPGGDADVDAARRAIWALHEVDEDLQAERATMYQVVDRGRALLQGLTCPQLETEVADFAEKWLNVTNEVSSQLKKLGEDLRF